MAEVSEQLVFNDNSQPDSEQVCSLLDKKVQKAVRALKAFEPPNGYWVAFSGGKDSIVVKHLCDMAGVKYKAHYSVTSVDPPELIQYIRKYHQDVIWDFPTDKNGKRITMHSLIREHTIPPTRQARYCCTALKESFGKNEITVTGVRWAESAKRRANHGLVDFQSKPKTTRKKAEAFGVQYKTSKHGSVILQDDNDESRRMVEQCFRTRKTMLNPIIDWTDEDVWAFIHQQKIPYCSLYDHGITRIGCVACPLSGTKNMERDFERWPQYKKMYVHAFKEMVEQWDGEIKVLKPDRDKCLYMVNETPVYAVDIVSKEKSPEAIMEWWVWMQNPVAPHPYIYLQTASRINQVLESAGKFDDCCYVMRENANKTKQTYLSARTSINSTRPPLIYNKLSDIIRGKTIVDYGCGKYEKPIKQHVESLGAKVILIDPYNRTQRQNDEAYTAIKESKIDFSICSNVLNVIDAESVITECIKNSVELGNGLAYISVYEGDKSGIGRKTGKDQWQRNQSIYEYEQYVPKDMNVSFKNRIMIVKSAKNTNKQAAGGDDK